MTTAKIIPPKPATTFSLLLWSGTLLFSITAGDFLFEQLAEGIQSTSRIYCFASYARSISHSLQNLLPLPYAASHIWMHFGWLKAHTKAKFTIFRTSQLSSNLAFLLPKVHAYTNVKQPHWTFLYSSNITIGFGLRFAINQKNWSIIKTRLSDKNIPNIYRFFISSQEFIYQALWKYTKFFKFGMYIYQLATLRHMRQNAYYCHLKSTFEDLLPCYCYAIETESTTLR